MDFKEQVSLLMLESLKKGSWDSTKFRLPISKRGWSVKITSCLRGLAHVSRAFLVPLIPRLSLTDCLIVLLALVYFRCLRRSRLIMPLDMDL